MGKSGQNLVKKKIHKMSRIDLDENFTDINLYLVRTRKLGNCMTTLRLNSRL